MVEKKLILKKLTELDKYLKQLRKHESLTRKELQDNLDVLWMVERGLQICIQIILDIGTHILSEEGIAVERYSDIFKELVKLDIIPEYFAEDIKGMAGFRNILVYEYADVNVSIVADTLNNSLDDFSSFAEYINEYLKKESNRFDGREEEE